MTFQRLLLNAPAALAALLCAAQPAVQASALPVAGKSAAAAACTPLPPDPANTYDAASTYTKLVRKYPFIRTAPVDLTGVRLIAEQVYWQQGSRCLALDLYLPAHAAAGTPALVVFVHGGGWQSGYRAEFAPLAAQLARRGVAAATISYRLSREAPYPAAVDDTHAAVRWLRANAGRYGFDPQRLVLAGGSAGGQIASLAGVTADRATPDAAVQAIVNIDGLSDFTSPEARAHEDDPQKKPSAAGLWLGGRYSEQPERWRQASPITHVHPGMPPVLFIGSGQPRFAVGREAMRAKMAEVGVASETVMLPDAPHSFWMLEPWLQPTLEAITAFLGRYIK